MAAYVIYECEVLDAERYEAYKPKAAASVQAAGGRYIVRGGDAEVLEGEAPASRTVVVEFPDRETARKWYTGQMYSGLSHFRRWLGEGNMAAMQP